MNTIYTRTITNEANKRSIGIEGMDHETPIFVLKHSGTSTHRFNALTDNVGVGSFQLADNKQLANRFFRALWIPGAEADKIFRF